MSKKISFIAMFALIIVVFYNLWDWLVTVVFSGEPFHLNPASNIAVPLVTGIVVGYVTYSKRNG